MFLLPVLLTSGYVPVVQVGQPVRKLDILAQLVHQPELRINLSQALSVPVRKVKKYIVVSDGQEVKKGDVLAEKPGVLGLNAERIISEVEGTIAGYYIDTGELVIYPKIPHTKRLVTTINSPIEGVVAICDNEKIVIQTTAPVMVAHDGFGHIGSGEVHVLNTNPNQEVQFFEIDASVTNKILVGGAFSREGVVKAVGMNAVGIITSSISPDDAFYLQQKYSIPVLIVKEPEFNHVLSHSGKTIYIDGLSKSIVI